MKEILISPRYDLNKNVMFTPYIQRFLEDPVIQNSITTYDTCPCCTQSELVLFAKQDDLGIPIDRVVCDYCGFIFSYKYPNEEGLSVYYSKYYRNIYLDKTAEAKDFEHYYIEAEKNWSKKPWLDKKNDPLIVEIGCGGGWFLKPYHKRGYRTMGFDYDPNLVSLGKNTYGLDLYCGSIDEAIEKNIQADYLFLSQVLEHIPNPFSFLSKLKHILKPNGIVKIAVPSRNFLMFGGGATNYDPLEILSYPHFSLFDEYSFSILAKRAGFQCEILLGGQFVIRKTDAPTSPLHLTPGKTSSVIRYLKRCESMVNIKNTLFSHKNGYLKSLRYRLHYIYFALHPIKTYKMLRHYNRL